MAHFLLKTIYINQLVSPKEITNSSTLCRTAPSIDILFVQTHQKELQNYHTSLWNKIEDMLVIIKEKKKWKISVLRRIGKFYD